MENWDIPLGLQFECCFPPISAIHSLYTLYSSTLSIDLSLINPHPTAKNNPSPHPPHSPVLCQDICCVFWLIPHIGALRERQETNRKSKITGMSEASWKPPLGLYCQMQPSLVRYSDPYARSSAASLAAG